MPGVIMGLSYSEAIVRVAHVRPTRPEDLGGVQVKQEATATAGAQE